jgi:hypothetical protein
MTIPISSIPAAVLYLFNGVTALVNDPAVLISYGPPGPRQPDDIVAINLGIDRMVVPYQMVGSGQAGWLDESYSIEVVVSVFRGGDDVRTAFERACTLADQVVYVVRSDPSLGGAVVVAHPEQSRYETGLEDDHKGLLVTVTIPIACRARI